MNLSLILKELDRKGFLVVDGLTSLSIFNLIMLDASSYLYMILL